MVSSSMGSRCCAQGSAYTWRQAGGNEGTGATVLRVKTVEDTVQNEELATILSLVKDSSSRSWREGFKYVAICAVQFTRIEDHKKWLEEPKREDEL